MATIECYGEKVLFASDVQGPMYNPTLETILAERPHLVIIGGPPIYLAGFRVRDEHVQKGMKNLVSVVKNVPTTERFWNITSFERKDGESFLNQSLMLHRKWVTVWSRPPNSSEKKTTCWNFEGNTCLKWSRLIPSLRSG